MILAMAKRITIRDVARHCGYSASTVSMALRDHAEFPAKTRALIQQAAQDLGYHPDPFLATLAAQRWQSRSRRNSGNTMAVIAEGANFEGRNGMYEQAAHLGYRLEVFPISEYPTGQRLAEVLFNRGIQGVLLGQISTPGYLDSFDWSHFSAVAVSEGSVRPPTHLVMPNHHQAVHNAWDHAMQLGYQRIGMVILDDTAALDFHDRRSAFLDQQTDVPAARRLPVLPLSIINWSEAEHRRQVKTWVLRNHPDVVLGFNDFIEWKLRDADIHVPQDVAFISLWNARPNLPFAGMRLFADEVGRRAVNWVDSLLRARERGLPLHPSTQAVDFVWQDGISAPKHTPRQTKATIRRLIQRPS